jgi:hypothetical protein
MQTNYFNFSLPFKKPLIVSHSFCDLPLAQKIWSPSHLHNRPFFQWTYRFDKESDVKERRKENSFISLTAQRRFTEIHYRKGAELFFLQTSRD